MEKLIKKTTLAEQAYEYIKKLIITGELKPGEELPEERLAVELGISRTPLREALKRLAVDALIELRKTRPAIVAKFTRQDVVEIMELRKLLEIQGLEKLSKADQKRFVDELKENAVQQWKMIQKKDFVIFMDLDQEFHSLLCRSHKNRRLKEIIKGINTGGSRAFMLLSDAIADSAEKAYAEHQAIIDAIEKGNIDEAKQQLAIHLDNIENRLLKYILQEEL
ncbi:GntR family transcriptional regulator [Planococcus shenhongbingii]|uniref:GntR family transcriptional regulator n=1 Tax=Planococcus shenhongbingii TaxID=3058398 RepID=UPI002615C877|nr:GntR family transcriptional regulator [Planococcus sp. N016]WKA57002.1 GntR family transcriptional regulator [Planococcus sp. N016]